MKILFAQGNPGPKYTHTRHNVGFMALDTIALKNDAIFSNTPKFHAEIAEYTSGGEKILLVKPSTFYNETGTSARALIDFYKLQPAVDLLVIHDELALPFGVVRTRLQGSDAGNNGIKSLNSHLGQNYARIRIGIYNPLRDQTDDVSFVLGAFSADERKVLPEIFEHAHNLASKFISSTFESTSKTL